MDGMTVSNILHYFSAAKRIEFVDIKFYDLKKFTINEAIYNISEIWFQSCFENEISSNEKIFDLVDKIVSNKCIQTSLKEITFNTKAFMSYSKWE